MLGIDGAFSGDGAATCEDGTETSITSVVKSRTTVLFSCDDGPVEDDDEWEGE